MSQLTGRIKYQFNSRVWQYAAPKGGWFFLSMPADITHEIRTHFKWQEEGWGRLKATARINHTEWATAIWFDTKQNTYLLPLKADIRKQEKLGANAKVSVTIWV